MKIIWRENPVTKNSILEFKGEIFKVVSCVEEPITNVINLRNRFCVSLLPIKPKKEGVKNEKL